MILESALLVGALMGEPTVIPSQMTMAVAPIEVSTNYDYQSQTVEGFQYRAPTHNRTSFGTTAPGSSFANTDTSWDSSSD